MGSDLESALFSRSATYATGPEREKSADSRSDPRALTMIVARRFTISGRVQGVGFRWFTKDVADREGVNGWVRNLPDGRVEALVEGDVDAVTRVERALRMGPRGARVA